MPLNLERTRSKNTKNLAIVIKNSFSAILSKLMLNESNEFSSYHYFNKPILNINWKDQYSRNHQLN